MLGLNKKKKDLVAVDHNKIYYRTFRKNFYVEVSELAKMSPEGWSNYYNLRGATCVFPLDFGLE